MSQHIYPAILDGRPVTVMLGFDRPLQGFFMVVDDDTDDYPYSNLCDPELLGCMGMSPTVDHFVGQLERMGLPVLPNVIAEAQADQQGNVGNRCVHYDA